MYDCFNMAYQDNANDLQLNIKVNAENLLPIQQKYTSGSLRLPADPSWPKIPQRKLIDSMNDTIEPPCIVTLTGTPRRSRTIVQTPMNQSPKSSLAKDSAYSSFHQQKITSSMQTLKRVPGYVDPRFKKVTTAKRNQPESEKSYKQEIRKPINQRDVNTQYANKVHESEKSHDVRKKDEISTKANPKEYKNSNVDQGTRKLKHCANNSKLKNVSNVSKDINKNEIKLTMNDANTQVDIGSPSVQESNGQMFLVLDKKFQPQPLNAIQLDTITIPQEYVSTCYNVQVPVLTYKNIPMQIAAGTNDAAQSLNNLECKKQNDTVSSTKKQTNTPPDAKALDQTEKNADEKDDNNNDKDNCLKSNDDCAIKTPGVPVNQNAPQEIEKTKIQRKQESSDSEYYIPNTRKKSIQNNVFQRLNTTNAVSNTSGDETTDSEFITQKINKFTIKPNVNKMTVHGDINSHQTNMMPKEKSKCFHSKLCPRYKTTAYATKARNKSEQNVSCIRNEYTKKLCRSSEPHIAFKQRKVAAKYFRKAKSYFQKNSYSALADSDYTLIWPNSPSNKQKFNNYKMRKMIEKGANAQVENNLNPIDQSYLSNDCDADSCQEKNPTKTCLQKEYCKCDTSPRTDVTIGGSKNIPPKTQELLNKSYWEYYNKLKHKIKNTGNTEQQYLYQLTMNSLKCRKEKTDEFYNKERQSQLKLNPELHTLQQCSALSSMINKALDSDLQADVQTKQLCINQDTKLDPIANNQSSNIISSLNHDQLGINQMKYIKNNENENRFLEMKSIIFFGGMMYILIIFLPMLYDYFYHEEYSDYENLSYLELAVDYMFSSFKEAFGGVFNGLKQIFYYPVRLKLKSKL